jgi:hypothetical protein
MRSWALGRVGHVVAAVNPVENEELAALRAQRTTTQYPLGDLPLVVITRRLLEESGADAAALETGTQAGSRDHRRAIAAW